MQAIAACDARGGWYRVYPGYHCAGAGGPAVNGNGGPGATYNRLGPAVAMAAAGEPTRWSAHIAADDSSQASALAAAAVARVLDENRDLSAAELRALLALTADVPAVVDGGSGLAAGAFDARDRLGHNFKTGHGPVNVPAACLAAADPVCLALLATRPVPDPAGESIALALARAWSQEVRRAADRGVPPAREYREVAGRLSRLFLTSLPVQEALCWLARHVRGLVEAARPGSGTGRTTARWWNEFVTRSIRRGTRSTSTTPTLPACRGLTSVHGIRRGLPSVYRLGKNLWPCCYGIRWRTREISGHRSRGRRCRRSWWSARASPCCWR